MQYPRADTSSRMIKRRRADRLSEKSAAFSGHNLSNSAGARARARAESFRSRVCRRGSSSRLSHARGRTSISRTRRDKLEVASGVGNTYCPPSPRVINRTVRYRYPIDVPAPREERSREKRAAGVPKNRLSARKRPPQRPFVRARRRNLAP